MTGTNDARTMLFANEFFFGFFWFSCARGPVVV